MARVCGGEDEAWRYLSRPHETRADAEAELRRLRVARPEAFVTHTALTRVNPQPTRPASILTFVRAQPTQKGS